MSIKLIKNSDGNKYGPAIAHSIVNSELFREVKNDPLGSVVVMIDGKNKEVNGVSQVERARIIKRTLGTKVAALYLRKRGWSVEASAWYLASK